MKTATYEKCDTVGLIGEEIKHIAGKEECRVACAESNVDYICVWGMGKCWQHVVTPTTNYASWAYKDEQHTLWAGGENAVREMAATRCAATSGPVTSAH